MPTTPAPRYHFDENKNAEEDDGREDDAADDVVLEEDADVAADDVAMHDQWLAPT